MDKKLLLSLEQVELGKQQLANICKILIIYRVL
jgi:hypothetical protein